MPSSIHNKAKGKKEAKINIVVSKGAFGASEFDDVLDTHLRRLSLACPHDEGDWVEKYGADYENDVFMMKPFCWCEKEDCDWCYNDAPNFLHKKTGFRVRWYKYIGRGTEIQNDADLRLVFKECHESLAATIGKE